MPTIIELKAIEQSSFIFNCCFYDENSADVVPNSLYWSLTDASGNAINSRSMTPITSLQSSIYVLLTSADLSINSASLLREEDRVFTIQGNYDSSLGLNLPIIDCATFKVVNLMAIKV